MLPTERLVSELEEIYDTEERVDNLLEDLNVSTIHVSYERLFSSDNAETSSEWMKIFKFLGVGRTANVTATDVQNAVRLETTSLPFHNMSLDNFDDVQSVLIGTKFSSLLH